MLQKFTKMPKNCRQKCKKPIKTHEKIKNEHSCEKFARAARPLRPPFSISVSTHCFVFFFFYLIMHQLAGAAVAHLTGQLSVPGNRTDSSIWIQPIYGYTLGMVNIWLHTGYMATHWIWSIYGRIYPVRIKLI